MTGGNLIVNGNFEADTGRVKPTGWQADRTGQVRAEDGDNAYSFSVYNQEINATIRQTFATEVGKTYTLSLKGKVGVTPNDDAGIKVDILDAGSALVDSKVFEVPGGQWSDHTLTFTATSTSTTLRLTDRIPSDVFSPVLVDDVSVTATAPAGNTITGTPGDDYLLDTAADDTLLGGDGNDVFDLRAGGNDTVDGQGGDYNQIDLPGKISDYTFTAKADGSVTVTRAGGETDTLCNIDGVYFYGDGKWAAMDSLVAPAGNTITGTPGNDYLIDTAANDTMLGGDGNDVFHMSWGSDDIVDGQGGDYNQVDFVGKSSDYSFSKAEDGSVIVKTTVGETDTLRNIDGVYFYGDNKWTLVDDLFSTDGATVAGTPGDDYLQDTAANDIMLGGGGNDVFDVRNGGDDVVDGQTGDYNQLDVQGGLLDYKYVQKDNGEVSMIGANAVYTLKNIDGVYFYGDNKWYAMADLVAPQPGNEIVGTSGDDYLLDTTADDVMYGDGGNDVFDLRQGGNDVVDGQSGDYNQVDLQGAAKDYTFLPDANGFISVTRGQEKDLIKDIDGVYFYGENKWYPVADLIGQQPGNVINGTPGDDYLIGTPVNDVMNGGGGVDVFRSSRGDDVINGGAGYNQVDYDGKAANYQVTKSNDGAYHVSNATYGNDTLHDIGGVWFSGEDKWYAIDDLLAEAPVMTGHDIGM